MRKRNKGKEIAGSGPTRGEAGAVLFGATLSSEACC